MSGEERHSEGKHYERQGNEGLISLLAGVGLGALLGGAITLLLAPQSGEQTRQRLRESAEDVLGNIKESIDELRTKLDEVRSAVRRSGEEELGGETGSGTGGAAGTGEPV